MKKVLPILAIIVVAAAAVAVWFTLNGRSAATEALGGTGTIEATNVNVASQASGRIMSVGVKSGDIVKKGAVLFRIDPTLADYQVRQAQAGVKAASATLKYAKDNDKSKAEIAQDRAQLDQARIALKMAQVQAGYSVVKAPIDGVAIDVAANSGELASPGQTLAVLGDVMQLTVSVYVPESRIGQVKVGQSGTLTIDSASQPFQCKVTSVASQAEFTPSSIETKDQRVKLVYEVKLSVSDPSGTLKPGMPADVKL